jgi:nucleoside-diphosphate-sugar epimerase
MSGGKVPDVSGRFYLVTGGTGFLGSALVRRLVGDGAQVRVLDNNSRGRASRLEDLEGRFDYVEGDIRDAAVVERACAGIDVVCHLAFVNGTEFFYTKPDLVLDVAVKGMTNVIDGAIGQGVPELMLMSSSEVYQQPDRVPTDETVALTIPDCLNPRYSYAAGKLISEVMAVNYGRRHLERVTIVRPHNVYGPDMGEEHVIPQFVARLKALQTHPTDPIPFPIQGTGLQTRSFVFVEDFIDGVALVLERGEHLGIYHVGTLEEVSIETLAHLVAGHYGRPIEIVPGRPADGGTTRRCPDITKMTKLGYRPRFTLRDALPGVVRWYDEHLEGTAVERA